MNNKEFKKRLQPDGYFDCIKDWLDCPNCPFSMGININCIGFKSDIIPNIEALKAIKGTVTKEKIRAIIKIENNE